jgi:hypothetical protein
MKKYLFLTVALSVLITPVCFSVTESFVVEKPKRSTSPKKVQDRCCTACADGAESICALIGSLNGILQMLLLDVRQFVEGEKDARFERASKEQLAQVLAQIKNLTQEIESLQKRANEISAYLQKI